MSGAYLQGLTDFQVVNLWLSNWVTKYHFLPPSRLTNKGLVVGIPEPKNVSCHPGGDDCILGGGGSSNISSEVGFDENFLLKNCPFWGDMLFFFWGGGVG